MGQKVWTSSWKFITLFFYNLRIFVELQPSLAIENSVFLWHFQYFLQFSLYIITCKGNLRITVGLIFNSKSYLKLGLQGKSIDSCEGRRLVTLVNIVISFSRCGHCKKLEPVYKQLAKQLSKDSSIVIAKYDATANDLPEHFDVTGFPTVYFVKSSSKESPVLFEGDRTLEGLQVCFCLSLEKLLNSIFIEKHCF